MADTVDITAGSGTTIATQDEGGVHYQEVKLTASGNGTTEALSKAEDSAHSTGEHGIMALAVRNDTLAALAGTDGDYAPLQVNASGALFIQEGAAMDVSAATVTVDLGANNDVINAGTFAVQEDGAALTALQLIDDSIYTDDAAGFTLGTSKGVAIMGFAGPQTVDSGDMAVLAATTSGALHVNLLSQTSDVTIADGGNVISTDWNGTAPPIGAGTEATALRVTVATDSTGVLSVDDNGGALTVDASQLDIDDLAATADSVAAALDTSQIMNGLTSVTPVFAVIDAATSGDNTLVAAAGASNKIRVFAAFLVAAGTVTTRFESGASGTALTGQMNLVANTGFVLPFNPLGWFETAANTLLNLELSGAVSVDGSLVYGVVQ